MKKYLWSVFIIISEEKDFIGSFPTKKQAVERANQRKMSRLWGILEKQCDAKVGIVKEEV